MLSVRRSSSSSEVPGKEEGLTITTYMLIHVAGHKGGATIR